jgi:hypothetical protein
MNAREIVRIIRELEQEDDESIQQRFGTQAQAAAQSMESLLAARLLEESPHAALWEQFRESPESAAAALTGVLEMIFEADPAFAERLDAFGSMYEKAMYESEVVEKAVESEEAPAIQSDVSQDLRQDVTLNAAGQGQTIDKNKYLYGDTVRDNKPTTPISETEGVSVGESAQVMTRLGTARGLGVPQLFEQLQRAVRDNPALSEVDKNHLVVEIQAIRRQVVPDEAGLRTALLKEKDLVRRLENIQRIAPDIADFLFSELASASEDVPDAVQRAVAQVQSPPEK